MNKRIRTIIISAAALAALLGAFLAGAYAYKLGLLSTLKRALVQPTLQPTATVPATQPDFAFEFLLDPQPASLNKRQLPANQDPLKFLVAGHIYGKPGDSEYHPAPTLLRNIALLEQMDPDFVVFLGDMVWKPSEENFDLLAMLILDEFSVPAFNAVGNHDVTKRDLYQSRFGNTVYSFGYKDQLFIVLDTTLQYYDLTQDQYAFLRQVFAERAAEATAVHIFMHHVLFLEENEVVSKELAKPNEGDGRSEAFWEFVLSDLVPLSQEIPVYVYAGDVGAFSGGNLSPLYKTLPEANITFVATGLGGSDSDSILIVENSPEGIPEIRPFSLSGRELGPIEEYSLQGWFKK